MEAERISDDPGHKGTAWAPIPKVIAQDLRLHLEAELPDGVETKQEGLVGLLLNRLRAMQRPERW